MIMSTMSLEAEQTKLIRRILNVSDVTVLNKVKKLLYNEEQKAGGNRMGMSESCTSMTKAEILDGFDQACRELKQNLEDKLEFKTLEEALDEL